MSNNTRKAKPVLSTKERLAVTPQKPAPAICLVNPQMGENIGAAARAMANFGLDELLLVSPRDPWPNEKAYALCSGATWPLDNAQLFETASDAMAQKTLVIATTGTPRQINKPLIGPIEAVRHIKEALAKGEKPVVLFGAERSGLDNEVINSADLLMAMPTDFRFPSLNLAQSVAVFCYAFAADCESLGAPKGWQIEKSEPAPRKYLDNFFDYFIQELDRVGFFWPEENRTNMIEVLRTPIVRARFAENEFSLFRGAIRALIEGPRRRWQSLETEKKRKIAHDWFAGEIANAALKSIYIEDNKAIFNYVEKNQLRVIVAEIENMKVGNIISRL